ncbi:cysteine desulfurase family protein [Nitratifractor sp.]
MQAYLDNNRATAVDPQVLAAMEPLLKEPVGDLNALHSLGASSRKLYTEAMEKLYAGLHAPEESDLFLTSGAAENHSTLMMGIYIGDILTGKKNAIILSERESPSMMEAAKLLESQGCRIHYLPLNAEGVVEVESLYDYITPRSALVSVPMVDPETGAIQPVGELAEICRKYDVPFHTDATQALGRIPVDLQEIEPDILSFSSETLHAPSGVGAVWLREGAEWMPMIFGRRNHYESYRGGPLNLCGAVGLGKAMELASDSLDFEMEDARELRDKLEEALREMEGVTPLVPWALRIPNTLLVAVEGVESEMMLAELAREGVQAYSYTIHPFGDWKRRALTDIFGLDPKLRHSTVGFALSRFTTKEEIDHTIKTFREALDYLRDFSAYDTKGEQV